MGRWVLVRTAACLAALLSLAVFGAGSAGAEELTLPSGFRDTTVLSGLEEPTNVKFAPGGQVFVAEKSGTILIYESVSDPIPEVFAELSTAVYDKGDRGLLGLALDPSFGPAHPYVYALYTFDHVLNEDGSGEYPHWGSEVSPKGDPCPLPPGADVDDCPVSGRLVRLTAEFSGGQILAAPGNLLAHPGAPLEKVLLEDWCQQDSTHSIGQLQFGPEGALYVSGGEGAGYVSPDYGQIGWPHPNMCADPPTGFGVAPTSPVTAEGGSLRSQDVLTPENPISHADPTSLDGSLLRIDPETGEGWPTNPLASSPDLNARRIVATGFRNPFRFTLDPSGEHAYVDNVGSSEYEEIDRVPLASSSLYDSGWPCYEGPEHQFLWKGLENGVCERLYSEPDLVSAPLFDYSHDSEVVPGDNCPHGSGSAITGNAVYPGGPFPAEYEGALFFADSVRGCIWVMGTDGDGAPDPSTLRLFGSGEPGVYDGVDIENGPEGDLYYVQMFDSGFDFSSGTVHKISFDPGAPKARLKADVTFGPENHEFQFDAGESSDPDVGEVLSYEWDFDEAGFAPGGSEESRTFNDAENHTVAVRVEDGTGKTSVAELTVYPGDEPPEVEIESPGEGLHWHVGQEISFSGSAEDAEGNPLRYTHLYWDTRLLHCPFSATECHTHPLQVFPAVESGSLSAPDHDYPSFIELILTATDARGLAATTKVKLEAEPVVLTLDSVPSGAPMTDGQVAGPSPLSATVIKDSHLSIDAPQTFVSGGKTYSFEHWSDGGAAVHTVLAGGSGTYTAFYSTPSPPPNEGPIQVHVPRAPSLKLVGHPPKATRSTSARFVFASDEAGAEFRCKLDRAPFRPCSSPKVFHHLHKGAHTFKVLAVLPGGGPASAPKSVAWRVLPPR